MTDALVSVIMPSFNTGNYIMRSIESVINQTYTNWELIIVDDCSNDNTDEVLSDLNDERIKISKNEIRMGSALSRNKALLEAKGKWIAFLDSDDLWMPTKLEKQIKFMKSNNYHFSYTNYMEIDEDDNLLKNCWTGPKVINRLAMYSCNYMGCLTVMYDREYVGLIQIPNLKKRNDYAIWIKVAKKCSAYLCDEYLAQYRIRKSGSVLEREKNPLYRFKFNYLLFRQSEMLNPIMAGISTCINIVCGVIKKIVYKREALNYI